MTEDRAMPDYRVRLNVIFARDAQKAVILRRGPKTHYQLINWDLRTDRFTPGQWMKGFVRLWDLSPSGDKLIYWAHQYHMSAPWRRRHNEGPPKILAPYEPLRNKPKHRSPRKGEARRRVPRYMKNETAAKTNPHMTVAVRRNEGVWTAISTPPFFSALAIWPSFGHWTGGGVFVSDREIILNENHCGMAPKQNVRIPNWVKFRSSLDCPTHQPRRPASWGWHDGMCDRALFRQVEAGLKAAGAVWVEWAAPRQGQALLFACDGCVYRLRGWRDLDPAAYLSSAEKLADFRDARFTLIPPPPEAMQW